MPALTFIEVLAKRVGKAQQSLYDKLGGAFAIAAVVDRFSDSLIDDPIVGRNSSNPKLRDWHRNNLDRLPGLKFMRTLWVIDVTGGPIKFKATRQGKTRLGLEEAHRRLQISSKEFDAVVAVLRHTLDEFKVPISVKLRVLKAFISHKKEVTAGYMEE